MPSAGWILMPRVKNLSGSIICIKKFSMRNERMLTGLIFGYEVINLPKANIILEVLLL